MKFKLFNKGKFVGYELHELNNSDFISIMYSVDNAFWMNSRIPHDVKRLFSGRVDIKGVEIYDNDKVSLWGLTKSDNKYTDRITYRQEDCCFGLV